MNRPIFAMACNYPITIALKLNGIKTGELQTVACGQCMGCRIERSRQWAVRITHETKCHDENCFLTLTYNDENLPENGSLVKEHMQLFIKRLRKSIEPKKIRYFQCGEYGSQTHRPHYHMILFGHEFPDRKYLKKSGDNILYTSETLDDLWTHGHCQIGDVSFDSARYVAGYCVDKLTGDRGLEAYQATGRVPPYATMSRRPGIGALWLENFASDVYPADEVISNGHAALPPAFYDKWLEKHDPELFRVIKEDRKEKALSKNIEDQRFRDREEILKRKLKNGKKSI